MSESCRSGDVQNIISQKCAEVSPPAPALVRALHHSCTRPVSLLSALSPPPICSAASRKAPGLNSSVASCCLQDVISFPQHHPQGLS